MYPTKSHSGLARENLWVISNVIHTHSRLTEIDGGDASTTILPGTLFIPGKVLEQIVSQSVRSWKRVLCLLKASMGFSKTNHARLIIFFFSFFLIELQAW